MKQMRCKYTNMISVDTPPPVLFFIICIYLNYIDDYAQNGAEKLLSMKWNKVEQNMETYSFSTVF